MYHLIIHGLVIRDSSERRTRSPHRRAGLTKLHDRVLPSCMRQPSLSPFTYVGFRVFAATRQGALAMGLHGLHPRNTGTRTPRDTTPSGLFGRDRARNWAQVVRQALYRVNAFLRGLWAHKAGSGQIASSWLSPLGKLWSKEK